jgi:hypothetical protein
MGDMSQIFIEVCVLSSRSIIDNLIGYRDCAGFRVGADTSHCSDTNDPFYTKLFQRPDIGPVIHLVGRNGVFISVTRQKDYLVPVKRSENQGRGRFPERGVNSLPTRFPEYFQAVQPGTSDDCQFSHALDCGRRLEKFADTDEKNAGESRHA